MQNKTLLNIVKRKYLRAKAWGILLLGVLLLLAILATKLGWADIYFNDIGAVISGKITGAQYRYSHLSASQVAIIWDIRLPRILCAIIVGCGLAVSGATFQAILMNPLADSYTMGVSTGAAFGASLAIFLNVLLPANLPVTIFAFSGALLTLLVVISVSKVGGYVSSANLVIAGIIVSCILSAAISLIKSMSGEHVAAIVSWLIGSFAARNWEHVLFAYPIILICVFLCYLYAEELNVLSIGDNEARNLGIDASQLRLIFLLCGSLITAVCVSISGIIGFVGLVVPHLLRFIVGSDNRILIPLSAITGALLLLLADTFARSFLEVEIPVGVITTLLGGPFFFYIFRKRNKYIQ